MITLQCYDYLVHDKSHQSREWSYGGCFQPATLSHGRLADDLVINIVENREQHAFEYQLPQRLWKLTSELFQYGKQL